MLLTIYEHLRANIKQIYFCMSNNFLSMQKIAVDLTLVKDILRQNPKGMSITDIAEKIGMNKHKVGRYLDILHASGHVDLRTFGMAKVYTPSSRIPLSALLSYTTDLVMVVNEEFQILQANDPMIHLINLNREQIIHHDLRHVTLPDPSVLAFLNELINQIHTSNKINEIRLFSNPPRIFHIRIVPTTFEDGSVGNTLILEDITTEREAIEEIHRSREFFREMISNLSDGLMVASETEVFYINNRLVEILGYTKEEIAALEPDDIAHPDEKKKVRELVERMMRTPSSLQEIQYWAYKKNGDSIYLNARMSAVPYGDSIRFYVLISDMTERRKKEEQEYLQTEIIKRAVEQMPRPIYCYRSDGEIFLINLAFCQLFGILDEQSAIGRNIHEVIAPHNLLSLTNRDKDLISQERYITNILEIEQPDGNLIRYPVEKSPIAIKNAKCTYIFGVIMTDSPIIDNPQTVE